MARASRRASPPSSLVRVVAPELAYVTAQYAALAPFGKVAALLSELLPVSGAANAGTIRNRTLRVGQEVVQPPPTEATKLPAARAAGPVVVGLDGGYVRSRHRPESAISRSSRAR